jgi:hypothetical protein
MKCQIIKLGRFLGYKVILFFINCCIYFQNLIDVVTAVEPMGVISQVNSVFLQKFMQTYSKTSTYEAKQKYCFEIASK